MIWRKPIVVLTSDDMERSNLAPYIVARAAAAGSEPLNIDGRMERGREQLLTVDERLYDDYFVDYIKVGDGADKPVWELFADYLQDHFG